jgi:aminopeptidase
VHDDDPVTAWTRHLAELGARTSSLNSRKFSALHYTGPGTDLTVGLPEGHVWHTAGMTTKSGIGFVANIPTEEVYTLPHKDRIDGVVASTMPLSYGGSLIDGFTLKFTGGRVVEARAKAGQDALDNLLNTDAQARALGEVALVPHSSPISQVDHIFLNLLFDENASNHLALGNAYRNTMDGGGDMTADEFAAAGGNESLAHVDFMIGSGAMDVDGVMADGTTEPVMRQGEWAFDA